jgi:peptidoglycan hydrolase-like protein with peptidoglycan-binding domain
VRPAHLLAVLVSAVVGAGLGVVGGLVTGGSHHVEDPLGLGIPLVNQDCTDQGAVLVIATGSQSSSFSDVTVERPGSVRYLATDRSCPTAWRPNGKEAQQYAAYLGPYSSVAAACTERMTVAHRGDFVTILRRGTTRPVQCLCRLSYRSNPVLRIGADESTLKAIYVFALQDLLAHLGRLAGSDLTGHYDQQTVDAIKQYQHDNALPANGVVDQATWHSVVSRGCKRYPS